ncbi:hypothetical protein Salat_2616100 [Sesamum alatum]|uniref:Uncharacterized protein n=1 Tax=Sesamum alatum TaxID=300844 RepID=A0AAE1XNH3_9LAMI|nr:hypothetical protein Salat_2616100 [Sesamum alatum]
MDYTWPAGDKNSVKVLKRGTTIDSSGVVRADVAHKVINKKQLSHGKISTNRCRRRNKIKIGSVVKHQQKAPPFQKGESEVSLVSYSKKTIDTLNPNRILLGIERSQTKST